VKDRWKKCVGLLTLKVFRYEEDMGADKTKIDEGQALQGGSAPSGASGEAGEPVSGRQVTEADRRRERAAQKLRENLSRRKQQVRARRAGQADETDGLPAAKAGDNADSAAKRDESQ
jgi:hypothetical protein